MDIEKKLMLLHLAAGIVAGYLSYIIMDNLYAAVIMIVVLFMMRSMSNVLAKEKKKIGWWLGNGGVVYIFIWFMAWVIFLNLL